MNKKILSLLVVLLFSVTGCYTQTMLTVSGTNSDISENLNLEAVATLFGESRNLEDFEAMLNDPRNQISNLDLNHDGYVDYIRVVESEENGDYVVTLQDVLGNNLYQDVATIDVWRNTQGYPQIEIVGNPYFYGPNYAIQPIFQTTPLIFSIFWNPNYRLWVSPYYWNYYPGFFRPWRALGLLLYQRHIHSFVREPRYYRYVRTGSHLGPMLFHYKAARNDYERMHPGHDFIHRNKGYKNARDLYQKRNGYNHNVYRPAKSNVHRPAQDHNVNRPAQNPHVKPMPVRINKIKSEPVRGNKTPAKYRDSPVRKEIKRPSGNRNVKTSPKRVKETKAKVRIMKKAKVNKEKPKNNHLEEKKGEKKRY